MIAVNEIVSRLPDIMHLPQRITGMSGEYGATAIQAELTATHIGTTEAETKLPTTQTQLNTEQATKAAADTKILQLQAEVTVAQAARLLFFPTRLADALHFEL